MLNESYIIIFCRTIYFDMLTCNIVGNKSLIKYFFKHFWWFPRGIHENSHEDYNVKNVGLRIFSSKLETFQSTHKQIAQLKVKPRRLLSHGSALFCINKLY